MQPAIHTPAPERTDGTPATIVWTAVPTDFDGKFQRWLSLGALWSLPVMFCGLALWTLIAGKPMAWIFLAFAAPAAVMAALIGRIFRRDHPGRITVDLDGGRVIFEHLRFRTFLPSRPFGRYECPFDGIRWVQHWRNSRGPDCLYIRTDAGLIVVNAASTNFDLLHEALRTVGRNDPVPLTKRPAFIFAIAIGVCLAVAALALVL